MTSSMMPYFTYENEQKTFRLLPISIECPYNEMIFDTENKVLIVISKIKKKDLEVVPKTNTSFSLSNVFNNNHLYNTQNQEVISENYYQYFIEDLEDMQKIIRYFCGKYYNDEIEKIIFEKK